MPLISVARTLIGAGRKSPEIGMGGRNDPGYLMLPGFGARDHKPSRSRQFRTATSPGSTTSERSNGEPCIGACSAFNGNIKFGLCSTATDSGRRAIRRSPGVRSFVTPITIRVDARGSSSHPFSDGSMARRSHISFTSGTSFTSQPAIASRRAEGSRHRCWRKCSFFQCGSHAGCRTIVGPLALPALRGQPYFGSQAMTPFAPLRPK